MNKFNFLATILMAISMTTLSIAQETKKGNFFVGGEFSISTNKLKTSQSNVTTTQNAGTSVNIVPTFHYFVIDRLAVGGGLGYEFTKTYLGQSQTSPPADMFESRGLFVIQPSVSYFLPLGKGFYYTPEFLLRMGFGTNKIDNSVGGKATLTAVKVQVGLSLASFQYFLAKNWVMGMSLGTIAYTNETSSSNQLSIKNNQFNFGINLNATIKFNYFFVRK